MQQIVFQHLIVASRFSIVVVEAQTFCCREFAVPTIIITITTVGQMNVQTSVRHYFSKFGIDFPHHNHHFTSPSH